MGKKITNQSSRKFDKLEEQIQALYVEVDKLAKKKPDGPINEFKIGIINGILMEINEFLSEGFSPIQNFSVFDSTNLPTVSDIIFVLSQYMKVMDEFRYKNTRAEKFASGGANWVLHDGKKGPATKKSSLHSIRKPIAEK